MSRQIKDIKDKNTGLLVYPRTHAQATYMSDGSTVEATFNLMDIKIEGCAKTEDIPSLDGYAKESDLLNILFSSLQNNPINEDESGEINITDELGNIGLKVSSEGVFVKDVVAGEHILSNKANQESLDELIEEVNIKAVPTGNTVEDPDIKYLVGVPTGSIDKPIYINNNNSIVETSKYAGGTSVTLNGESKSASEASFYAPTSLGSDNQILVSSSNNILWKDTGYTYETKSNSFTAKWEHYYTCNISEYTTITMETNPSTFKESGFYLINSGHDVLFRYSDSSPITIIGDNICEVGKYIICITPKFGIAIKNE